MFSSSPPPVSQITTHAGPLWKTHYYEVGFLLKISLYCFVVLCSFKAFVKKFLWISTFFWCFSVLTHFSKSKITDVWHKKRFRTHTSPLVLRFFLSNDFWDTDTFILWRDSTDVCDWLLLGYEFSRARDNQSGNGSTQISTELCH